MLDIIKNFFINKIDTNNIEPEDTENKIAIAMAVLLLELAHIDQVFSKEEEIKIVNLISEQFQIDKNILSEIIKMAESERQESHDLWQFTNLINQNYDNDQKRNILDLLWKVAFVDGQIDKYEEYIIRKITKLLHLTHKDMINSKIQIKYNEKE